ncbi:YCF48-related protein [Methylomonas sp. MO1]|uniref:YCF48-related protein n=1 Tax=Methylomonas sp. MO1 TaxID=3073619 RepID=UPI0028A357B2|nr:YCF48-related protein [Methylomonas sp. MO1]MDT4290026.1 YCF48-related protein [Methylomonas sp. MO1]
MSGLATKHAAGNDAAVTKMLPLHWLSRPGFWLGWALMLALLSTVIAFQQAPHRNAYRPEPKLLSWNYWAYPVERNAFRRLPAIAGNLNDLAVSEDGQHIWVVGDGGLIVFSEDGGVSWQQGQIGAAPAVPLAQTDGFWIKEAQAGMPGAYPPQQQSAPTNLDNAPLSIRKTGSGEANAAREINPALDYVNQSPVQKAPSAPLEQELAAPKTNNEPTAPTSKNLPQAITVEKAGDSVSPPPVQKQKPIGRDPKLANLYSVYFVDTSNGWAVGEDGVILVTADGAKSWQLQISGTKEILNSVHFVNPAHGWVVGQAGVILATADGGKSWKNQASVAGSHLNSVTFSDELHGWAVGDLGAILATADGGQTWQAQAKNANQIFQSVDFIDNRRGWAVGTGGRIVATTDGGNTWQSQPNQVSQFLRSVRLLKDGLRGWVAGTNGTLVATTDGGLSWRILTSGTSGELRNVKFSQNGSHGWAVGADGTIVASADGGNSWQAASQKVFSSVQFMNNRQLGWVIGADGAVLSSTDAGRNWRMQEIQTHQDLFGLHILADGQRGWLTGSNGVIFATSDAGKNWRAQNNNTKIFLFRVQFLNDGLHGWAAGDGGLLVTRDGGKNWQLDPNIWGTLFAMHFSEDGQRGWLADVSGKSDFTEDGGLTWQSQVIGSTVGILDLQFQADNINGWAVGSKGAIFSTSDGGKNWHAQVSTTQQNLRGSAFAGDGSRGWAVGVGGTVVSTTNSGGTWQAQNSNTSVNLIDIDADNEGRYAWTVGTAGTLLATSDGGEHWQDPVLPYQRYPAPWYYLSWLPIMLLFSRGLRLQLTELREPEAHDPNLGINPTAASDKPTGPGSKDYLGSLQLARDLSAFLRNENTQPPLTLAITGDWGSGKSSVMNYLQAELRREGLRPVWYNAWHHQEEQQVLGSILECVRRQATPSLWLWLLPGLWFRLRLLTHRRFWLQLLAAALLTGFCWLAAFAYFHEEAEENQVWHFASHLAGLEQPAVLTVQGHARLCAQAGNVTNPAKPPADQLFSPADCEKLQCLVNADVSGVAKEPANCKDTLSAFASDDELLAQAGKVLEHELTQERKQAIVKQLEHSPGKAPFALPAWLTALLTVLTTVAGVVVVKGASLFGLASTDLLKTAISKTGVIEAAEPVGTRQIWERRFERLTKLLGRRRLVLFIDDLDRCSREHALRVLETCNFLVSSGELFIVMGIAPKYVLANVKLHFKELAEALHEFDDNGAAAAGAPVETAPARKPRSLARFYLQKLINIEVPVPTAGSEAMLNLLTGNGGEEDGLGQRDQRLQKISNGLVLTLQVFVLLAAMAWAAYHASQPIPGKSTPPVLATQSVAAAAKSVETNAEPVADISDKLKAESGITSFRADFNPEQLTPWPQRIGYSLLLLSMLVAGGLVWAGVNQKARNWLVDYLEMAYKAFGRDWFGPRQTQDTPEFAAALRIWYPLIHQTQSQPPEINSPRTVKAFLNRLRCFASRWPKTTGEHGEAQLVALAALHFYLGEDSPENWDTFLENLKVQSYGTECYLKLQSIVAEHKRQFGLPSDDDTKLFKYFIENLEIHKPQ